MTALYDWLVQGLVASPLALQIAVVLGVALPTCAVAALFLQRAVNMAGDAACRLMPQSAETSEKEPPLDA